jgi:hypothetical protein
MQITLDAYEIREAITEFVSRKLGKTITADDETDYPTLVHSYRKWNRRKQTHGKVQRRHVNIDDSAELHVYLDTTKTEETK